MKKLLKFIPFQLTIYLAIGILVGYYFVIQPIYLLLLLGLFVLFFLVVFYIENRKFEPSFLVTIVTFLLTFLIGVVGITFNNQHNRKYFYANQTGFSIEDPQATILSIRKVLKPSAYAYKYEAEVIQLNSKKARGKILLNIQKDTLSKLLNVDDRILVNTVFNEISNPKNPYEFDYKNYLKNQQIHHQIYIKNCEFLMLKSAATVKGYAAKVRNKINFELHKNGFKKDELGVITALLLGQRQYISEELMQSYTGAGAIHILAVSGLHVGIILLILTFLFKPLHYFKYGKLIASICVVISLWLFAILAGLSASVVRAVTMFTAIAIGMYSSKAINVYHTLIISLFILLLFNPFYLFEVGFQLSYLAVFAIVWIQPKIFQLWNPKLWIVSKFWQLFTVSLAAQIGVLPLSLFYFHQFPGLFFVSNLVIIPILGMVLGLGILVIILAVSAILPPFLAKSYSFVIECMNGFINWVSDQQYFIIQQITFSFALLIAVYIFIVFVLKWIEKKSFQRLILVFSAIIVLQSVFIFEKHKLFSSKNYIVFNKNSESIIGERLSERLFINTSISNFSKEINPIKNYLIGTGIDSVSILTENKNLYFFKNEVILIVDSLGVYNFKTIQPTIVILKQSPKINLDRLLQKFNPKCIVADASNYRSYLLKWEESCVKNNTPFYSTLQNGAFILN